MCLASLTCLSIEAANSYPIEQITQWIQIDSRLNNIEYTIKSINMESSTIDCGYHCQMVKLASIPNRNNGKLKIMLSLKYCPSYGEFELPFNIQDGTLITLNPGNYQTVVEGNYCGPSVVNIILSGDPHSNAGYHIDLASK